MRWHDVGLLLEPTRHVTLQSVMGGLRPMWCVKANTLAFAYTQRERQTHIGRLDSDPHISVPPRALELGVYIINNSFSVFTMDLAVFAASPLIVVCGGGWWVALRPFPTSTSPRMEYNIILVCLLVFIVCGKPYWMSWMMGWAPAPLMMRIGHPALGAYKSSRCRCLMVLSVLWPGLFGCLFVHRGSLSAIPMIYHISFYYFTKLLSGVFCYEIYL